MKTEENSTAFRPKGDSPIRKGRAIRERKEDKRGKIAWSILMIPSIDDGCIAFNA